MVLQKFGKPVTYSVRRYLRKVSCNVDTKYSVEEGKRLFSCSGSKRLRVLGIETSCDDTGAAVVDGQGNILSNCLHSQTSVSVALGGVLPPYAKAIHEAHINRVVSDALEEAQVHVQDLDAIAVTVKPGLPLSLEVGLNHAKQLVHKYRVPMIPIHHMEAHALTARMVDRIDFPFLVLLVSGGHCLLAVAKDVEDFLLLGTTTDGSPGEAFDKLARRLKLKTLPQCRGLSGGGMVERMALDGDRDTFFAPNVLRADRSCDFSFAGLKGTYLRYVEEEEETQGIVASHVIHNAADLCASFQYAILKHFVKPLQRAFLFCEMRDLLTENKTLVVSGGVACNQYLKAGLQQVCDQYNTKLVCPPPHLCTDNGIMIAWNGMEKLLKGRGIVEDPQSVQHTAKYPFGQDIRREVSVSSIKVPKLGVSV